MNKIHIDTKKYHNLTDRDIMVINDSVIWWHIKGPKNVYKRMVDGGLSGEIAKIIIQDKMFELNERLLNRGTLYLIIGLILTTGLVVALLNVFLIYAVGFLGIAFLFGPLFLIMGCFDIVKSTNNKI